MSYKEYLLSELSNITCCFGGCNYYWSMSAYDLLIFTLGSFVLISFLLFYYNRIPKSNISHKDIENPIFQSSDILLHSNSAATSFVIAEDKTSTLVKILAFVLILCVAFTPFHEFLGI